MGGGYLEVRGKKISRRIYTTAVLGRLSRSWTPKVVAIPIQNSFNSAGRGVGPLGIVDFENRQTARRVGATMIRFVPRRWLFICILQVELAISSSLPLSALSLLYPVEADPGHGQAYYLLEQGKGKYRTEAYFAN